MKDMKQLVKSLIQNLLEKDKTLTLMSKHEIEISTKLHILEVELKKLNDRKRNTMEQFPIIRYRDLNVPVADITSPKVVKQAESLPFNEFDKLTLKNFNDRKRYTMEQFPITRYRDLKVPDADITTPTVAKPAESLLFSEFGEFTRRNEILEWKGMDASKVNKAEESVFAQSSSLSVDTNEMLKRLHGKSMIIGELLE